MAGHCHHRPYRGRDRRHTARRASEAVGGLLIAALGLLTGAAGLAAWTASAQPIPALLGARPLVVVLQAGIVTSVLVTSALLLKRAHLTGQAAPRFVGAAGLSLAAVTAFGELRALLVPTVPAEVPLPVAAALVVASGLVALAAFWPEVDASLRNWHVLVGSAAVLIAVPLVVHAAALVVGAQASAAAAPVAWSLGGASAVTALSLARRRSDRLLAIGGLLLLAWVLAHLGLVLPGALAGAAGGVELLRAAAACLVLCVALDDVQAVVARERDSSLRSDESRQAAERELDHWRQRERERAHEARNALASISGAAAVLSDYTQRLDPDEQVGILEAVRAEAARLQALIDGAEAGDAQPVPLDDLIDGEVRFARHAGGEVVARIPEGLEVLARRQELTGIVRNLLVNARVHAPDAVAVVSATRVRGDRVRLRVADDGPGIPTEQQERVFEHGARLHRQRPGSGLGLTLARQLARENGGDLWAEHAPLGGAAFVADLPAVPASDQPDTGDAQPGRQRAHAHAPAPRPAVVNEARAARRAGRP